MRKRTVRWWRFVLAVALMTGGLEAQDKVTGKGTEASRPPSVVVEATVELGRYCEQVLAKSSAAEDEEWCFGVVADPHIYMYAWSDQTLARCLRGWTTAKAKFGIVVGDLGTGENLQADGPAAPGAEPTRAKQTDKFVKTISSVPDCPPVFLSVGNHEMDGDGKRSWLEAMFPGSTPRIEGNGNDRYFYYSFNYRGCHFVCLDANKMVDKRQQLGMLPEEELAWLEQDLAANHGKLTFVFLHEPVEQHGYDTPYYLLQNRARLLDILRRNPDAKWIFHGHLHYDAYNRCWGLNIVHANMANLIVVVKGQQARLARITPKGLEPAKGPLDLGAELAARRTRQDGHIVYRIAQDKLEDPGREGKLNKYVNLIEGEGDIRPTRGSKVLKLAIPLPGSEGPNSFTHLTRYLSTLDLIPIVEGMKFSYDVRCENSVYDNFALDLRISMPAGRARPKLTDQNGIPMENVSTYHSPSLQGKADGRWYHRECDLSELAGGWIDMITLCATRPHGAPYPAGELHMYVHNIQLTWEE